MKKLVKSFVILAVIAITLGSASAVFAQTSTPEAPIGFGGTGVGNRGNRSGFGSGSMLLYQNRDSVEDGMLNDEMIAAFADELGIDIEIVEERLANGETLADIALSQGMTLVEFQSLLAEIRTMVHDDAVEDGLLPGSQTGWFADRSVGMGQFGGLRNVNPGYYGTGVCQVD